jgi:hypothetical protein
MGNERREARRVNDEARMTNDEGSPNAQMTKGEWSFLGVLGFRHSFVIRHSSFHFVAIIPAVGGQLLLE